jgi:hypothetical protein
MDFESLRKFCHDAGEVECGGKKALTCERVDFIWTGSE